MCLLCLIKLLFFTKLYPFKSFEKGFLFHLKSSFRFRDIQIFVFSSSPLFSTVSHCLRRWSKRNPKVYDVISCLNKNLVTHFAWYLEKEIGWDTEPLSICRELSKEHFYKKTCRKCASKASPRPLFNFSK